MSDYKKTSAAAGRSCLLRHRYFICRFLLLTGLADGFGSEACPTYRTGEIFPLVLLPPLPGWGLGPIPFGQESERWSSVTLSSGV